MSQVHGKKWIQRERWTKIYKKIDMERERERGREREGGRDTFENKILQQSHIHQNLQPPPPQPKELTFR
jgi:hypothetical protein